MPRASPETTVTPAAATSPTICSVACRPYGVDAARPDHGDGPVVGVDQVALHVEHRRRVGDLAQGDSGRPGRPGSAPEAPAARCGATRPGIERLAQRPSDSMARRSRPAPARSSSDALQAASALPKRSSRRVKRAGPICADHRQQHPVDPVVAARSHSAPEARWQLPPESRRF